MRDGVNLLRVDIRRSTILGAGLGHDDQAIAWLEKDFESGNTVFLGIVTNTYIHERLRNNVRYQNFLRRMGLTVQ